MSRENGDGVAVSVAADDEGAVVQWPEPSPLEDWWSEVMAATPAAGNTAA
ncbi:hypothetical protein [Nocardia blacklockiae]|nr:hypothetical protein [Nocardia blacklockiae]MBF6169929.1 hypothetical protein [Nocardia blacklockiae]